MSTNEIFKPNEIDLFPKCYNLKQMYKIVKMNPRKIICHSFHRVETINGKKTLISLEKRIFDKVLIIPNGIEEIALDEETLRTNLESVTTLVLPSSIKTVPINFISSLPNLKKSYISRR